jgi:cytochrome c553
MKRLAQALLAFVGLVAWGLFGEGRSASGRRTHGAGPSLRVWIVTAASLLAVLAVLGSVVVVSGIVPIKASSGHWRITAWFLKFAMSRSVATHSWGVEAPALDAPGLALRGAGHFESGCRPCHGSPDLLAPRIALAMTPHPPDLTHASSRWSPEELFYIVKHGVKLTGMPAWPTLQRDDEVWAVVAFLLEMPRLDAESYRRLVHAQAPAPDEATPLQGLVGPEAIPGAVLASCARCHGAAGLGRGAGAFPALAGQRPAYLYGALRAYAQHSRPSGIMGPIAAALSPDEMRELADYYAALPARAVVPPAQLDTAAARRGESIALRGIAQQRVPACVQCHGPARTPRNSAYPVLAGQDFAYLLQQLELFHDGRRGGWLYAHLMREVAPRLTRGQMHDVAQYYASLQP